LNSFDYIIVGGGSAGCALANRISENGRFTVALLEAGGSHRDPLIQIPFNFAFTVPKGPKNWSFETVPQPGLNGRKGYQPRGKALGGSSSINAMIYIRGVREDYDAWEALGNKGWSYNDVLPYFKRAENRVKGADDFHSTGGPLSVSPPRSPNPTNEIFIRAGLECQIAANDDFNGASQEGIGYYELTQNRGQRCSSAHAYLNPAKNRSNLTVITHAFGQKIEFYGKRAIRVVAKVKGQTQSFRANKEIIIASGAFQSPQLLLLSGIGPRDKLAPHGIDQLIDLPGVGENLHDHIDYSLLYKSTYPHVLGLNPRSVFRVAFNQAKYLFGRRGIMTTNFNESGAFIYADDSEPSPDIQLHFAFSLVDQHGLKKHRTGGYTCHVCLLRPKSRGTLSLNDDRANSKPVIDPAFFKEESDLQSMLAGVKKTQQIMQAPAFDGIRGEALYASASTDDAELIEDIRNRADTIYHPVGTCKMGPDSDAMAVVDSSLKVRGVEGLRVIDASIMPSIISGNTNAPSIMIGEKGADLVLADA
jgi:choline dehydrogenase-like flavoprotein